MPESREYNKSMQQYYVFKNQTMTKYDFYAKNTIRITKHKSPS